MRSTWWRRLSASLVVAMLAALALLSAPVKSADGHIQHPQTGSSEWISDTPLDYFGVCRTDTTGSEALTFVARGVPAREAELESEEVRSPTMSTAITGSSSVLQTSTAFSGYPAYSIAPQNLDPGALYPQYPAALIGEYFSAGLDPHIDIYLSWEENYPEGYARLVRWGKAFAMGDEANYPSLQIDPAMYEASIIAYDQLRWKGMIHLRGCGRSPYYDRAEECVRYLRSRGRDWWTALAIMELESTYGTDPLARNDFGVCDGSFDMNYDLKGYCDYLYYYQVVNPGAMGYCGGFSNELENIMIVYNDHASYRGNIYELATCMKNWFP